MAAAELFYRMIGVNDYSLSKQESGILEVNLFMRVCEEIEKVFKSQYKDYFRLIKSNEEMEKVMLDGGLIRHVLSDILLTEEYSLEGIALYTQTSEEVICDLIAGQNAVPSLSLSRKIVELHRFVRPDLYKEIIQKITAERQCY